MHAIKILLFVLIALGRFEVSLSAACPGANAYGKNNNGNANALDSTAGAVFLMLGTGTSYTIDCCGLVGSWTVEILGTATIYMQIWRPNGTSYQLAGQESFAVSAATTTSTTLTPTTKITVRPGDRLGWYSSGANVIKHKVSTGLETRIVTMTQPTLYQVYALTGGTTSTTNEYAVQMTAVKDSTPSFSSPADGTTYTINNDKSVGYLITTLVWSDPDAGDTVTVSMATNSKFAFDTTSGTLKVGSSLAGPSTTETLVFTVKDFCLNSATVSIIVNIVNQPPVLYGLPASDTLSEDSTGDVLIYTINATDTVDPVTCSLVTAVSPFSVKLIPASSKYGLYVNSNPNFNYNTQNQYTFKIRCSDGYLNTTDGTFYLYLVQNRAPVITNLQGATVVSTNATLNTEVFKVAYTDYENDTVTFDPLVCDPSPCPFVIRDSGAIQLTQDISGLTTTGYDLNITVRDAKHVVGPKILTIIIKDINDPVLINNLPINNSYAVSENTALSTSVFAVSISDQDTQTWTYSMSSTPATGLSYFSINPTSGLITTAGSLLNYETLASAGTTSFTFTITVSDGKSSDTDPLVIEIINVNEAPSFATTAYSISHSEGPAGTVVGTPSFGVTDRDSGDSYTYSMTCGAYTSLFYLNPTSGQVTFQSNYDTDSGKPTTVNCIVTVTDSGGLTDTATLDIYITDINDNTPVFSPTSYSFFISYYASAGTTVGKVTATDGDTGAFGVLTYTLEQANLLDQYFTVDNTGQIVVRKTPFGNPIGYATSVTINATVTDAGGLTAKAPVTIVISDTTTTSTTTTTDRYRTFIEDNRNLAWLIPSIVALVGIGGFLTWLIYTCRGDNSFANFRRKFCNRRKQFKPRRLKTPPTPPTPPPPPRPAGFMTIRQPPPPKSEQLWRYDAEPPAPVKEPIREPHQNYDFWKHTDFRDPRLTNLL